MTRKQFNLCLACSYLHKVSLFHHCYMIARTASHVGTLYNPKSYIGHTFASKPTMSAVFEVPDKCPYILEHAINA